MPSFLVRSIILTTTFLTTSCSSSGPPATLRPEAPDPSDPPLTECLPKKRLRSWSPLISDPHGQGADLFGFGFESSGAFVRVDRFDLGSVREAAGTLIPGIGIRGHALASAQGRSTDTLGQEDWRGAVIVGRLHCTNPKLKDRTHSIRARVVKAVRGPMSTTDQRLWVAYKLELELEPGKKIVNVCRDKKDVAFPILGYWNEAGDYVRDPTKFSFACTKRHIATCLQLGYLDDTGSEDRLALLEACTRMMRADYCGDGRSYTKEGTFISAWDNRDIAPEKHYKPLVFEAAWNRRGMVCNARPRWTTAQLDAPLPKCLEKSSSPQCASAKIAATFASGEPLIFNDSCIHHPCKVESCEPQSGPRGSAQRGPCPKDERSNKQTLPLNSPAVRDR